MMADAVTTPEAAAPAAAATTPAAAASPASTAPVVNVHYPAPTGTVAPAPTLPTETLIPLPKSVYDQIQMERVEFGRFKAERDAEITRINTEKAIAVAKAGDAERAVGMLREQSTSELAAEREKLRQTEDRARRYALDGELSAALAAQPLAIGSAQQLSSLWRNEFIAEAQGDSFTVRTPTYQSVSDFVKTRLALPEFAKYLPATTSGGVGAPGASATTATPPAITPDPYQPATGGEALVLMAREARKAMGPNPQLTGGTNQNKQAMPAAAFGLYTPIQQMR